MSKSVDFENGHCPSCGELPNQSGEIEWVSGGIDQKMECGSCDCKWIDHYALVSSRAVKVINVPSDGVPLHKGVPF